MTSRPVSDEVMRGGILLAVHHGLTPDAIAYMHDTFTTLAADNGRKTEAAQ